jgi:S-adenosyl methyltransferase
MSVPSAPLHRAYYPTSYDPIVLTHARALLTSAPEGRTAYVDADLREPGRILDAPALRQTLDFTRPVALSLFAILHFVPDDAGAHDIIRTFLDALPSRSYLAMSHATLDLDPAMQGLQDQYQTRNIPLQLRSREEVARFFTGLDLVEPGIVPAPRWRPDGPIPLGGGLSGYGAVARKP